MNRYWEWRRLEDAVERSQAPFFFSKDAMAYFNSRRVHLPIQAEDGSVYFITSERFKGFGRVPDGERRYTVRRFVDGRIVEVGGFQQFRSIPKAKQALERASAMKNPTSQALKDLADEICA
jgi:hypothetical protein